jgi:hypothetical protein
MPELIEPDAGRHSAWLESHREWGPGLHEDGFGIGPDDEVESAASFAAWVDKLRSRPARLWWIVEQEVVLGGIALRPFTNDDNVELGMKFVILNSQGIDVRNPDSGRVLGNVEVPKTVVKIVRVGDERLCVA